MGRHSPTHEQRTDAQVVEATLAALRLAAALMFSLAGDDAKRHALAQATKDPQVIERAMRLVHHPAIGTG